MSARAINAAQQWLAERDIPGNQSDQRAATIIRQLIDVAQQPPQQHVRSVTYVVQQTRQGEGGSFQFDGLHALAELRWAMLQDAQRDVGAPSMQLGGLFGTYFASNGCRVDWMASQVHRVDVPESRLALATPAPEPVEAARGYLGYVGGGYRDTEKTIIGDLLGHIAAGTRSAGLLDVADPEAPDRIIASLSTILGEEPVSPLTDQDLVELRAFLGELLKAAAGLPVRCVAQKAPESEG